MSRDSGLTVWCPPLQCWRRVICTLPSTGWYSRQSALMDQPTTQATDRPTPTKPAQIPTSSLLSTTLGEMAKDVPTRRRKVGTRSPGSSGVSFGSCPVSSWNQHQPKTHEAANKGQQQVKQLTMSRYLVTLVPKTTTHQRHVKQPTRANKQLTMSRNLVPSLPEITSSQWEVKCCWFLLVGALSPVNHQGLYQG